MSDPSLYLILGALTTSFIIGSISYPILIKIAFLKQLVDKPDFARKLHKRPIPTLGGVIIYASTMIAYLLWFPYKHYREYGELLNAINDFKYVAGISLIIFLVGIKDDIVGVDNIKKLIIHILCAFVLAAIADIRITSLHGIFGINELPYWASLLITILLYVGLVNAWNMIDGIDALAASYALFCLFLYFLFFNAFNSLENLFLISALGGSLLVFLIYNRPPAKVYMGTTGANFLGFIIAFLTNRFLEMPLEKIPDTLRNINLLLISLSILAYPILDVVRVIAIRARNGINVLSPDRNHIHYLLTDKFNLSPVKVIFTILAVNVIPVIIAFFGSNYPTEAFIISATCFFVIVLALGENHSISKNTSNNKTFNKKNQHDSER